MADLGSLINLGLSVPSSPYQMQNIQTESEAKRMQLEDMQRQRDYQNKWMEELRSRQSGGEGSQYTDSLVSPEIAQMEEEKKFALSQGNAARYSEINKEISNTKFKDAEATQMRLNTSKSLLEVHGRAFNALLENPSSDTLNSALMQAGGIDPQGTVKSIQEMSRLGLVRINPITNRAEVLNPQGLQQYAKTQVAMGADLKEQLNVKQREEDRKTRERIAADNRAARVEAQQAAAEARKEKMSAQQMQSQRAVNALGGVASAVEALNEFSAGTTTGILPHLQTKDGMLNAVRNFAGKTVSKEESRQMNTIFVGIGRNLASIEASGTATGLGELTKKMESGTYITSDDTPYTTALKFADIRRIAVENIQPAIDSGSMPAKQAETAQNLVDRIKKAVPYDVTDVIKATRRKDGKEDKKTLGEDIKSKVPTGPAEKLPPNVKLSPGIHGPDPSGNYIEVYSDGTYRNVK